MKRRYQVRVELEGGGERRIEVDGGRESLAGILAANGMPLNTRCGQRGLCKGCEVNLVDGVLDTGGGNVVAPAVVRACGARLTGDVVVRVPARSRIEHRPQVGETFEIGVPYAHAPLFPCVPGVSDTAFAVDVGTTTVVVLLVDLVSGEVLSRAGGFNEQIRFGDNVLTRIEAAGNMETRVGMQRAIVEETIQPLLLRACEHAERPLDRVAGGAIAGNTTMLHLLVGEDPTSLGIAPFTPAFISGRRIALRGLAGVKELPVFLLPGIAAYIGADITAGVFATGMRYDPKPGLFIDIGTNGEIVLQSAGILTACATAAGPAFEGCGLGCGTRARAGAVCGIDLALDPFRLGVEVIGDTPLARAGGLCGSAYVDFLATARSSGLLAENGRFVSSVWDKLPEANRHFVDGVRAFRLADHPHPLWISEVDVALLLQAKAAIGAGIEILLESAGIRAADLEKVYLAGGFGMHLNVAHAIATGLLPGIRPEQVRVVGNTSLAGALLALIDRNVLEEMEELRAQTEVVELNLAADFEDRYLDHLALPCGVGTQ